MYKDIADYNGDIAWTKCLSIWNSKVARIAADATFKIESVLVRQSLKYDLYNFYELKSHVICTLVYFQDSDVRPPNEYRKNVQEIIMYIQEKMSSVK